MGGFYDDITGRTDAINELNWKKEQNKLKYDTYIGELERQLSLDKELATQNAARFTRQANTKHGITEQGYGLAQQQAYYESLAGYAELNDLIANDKRVIGDLVSNRAASGLKGSGTVEDLISTETSRITEREQFRKSQLDSQIASMVSGNIIQRQAGLSDVFETKQQASEQLAQFNEGSAYMELYNYKRKQAYEEYKQTDTYLQSLIDDQHSVSGYVGDVVNAAGGALAGAASGAALGAAIGTVGGLPGALVGGAIGGIVGFVGSFFG